MRHTTLVLAIALGAGSAGPALAAEPGAKPQPRKLLSRPELRACMLRESALQGRRAALEQAQADHVGAGAALSAEATSLSKVLRALDNADAAAVDAYNQRNDARNQQVEVHNKRAESLNATSADLQSAQADFMAECAARPFLQSDENALRKELGGAAAGERKPKAGQIEISPPTPAPTPRGSI